jgi:hypothetical protein
MRGEDVIAKVKEIEKEYYELNTLALESVDWLIKKVRELQESKDWYDDELYRMQNLYSTTGENARTYEKALREIAKETGTPYAKIAIEALGEDEDE